MNSNYSPEFVSEQKSRLIELKDQYTQELSKIARYDESAGTYMAIQPDFDSGSPEDMAENSMETEVGQTNTALIAELEKLLVDATDALARIEEGTYGICERLGEPISEERLKAYPAARTCEDHSEES